MQINVEDAGGCKRVIKVEVPSETVSARLAEGFKDINRQVQFPGFRKGKAPKAMLEKKFGKDVAEDVKQNLADEAVKEAVEEHALKLLGQAELIEAGEIKSGSATTLMLEAEVYPEFELPEYKGLELERITPKVEDHEIHAHLRGAQMQHGGMNSVERESAEGDFIRANVKVSVGDEQIFEQNEGLMEVGFGYIAGLQPENAEDALKGLKKGDEKSLKATLPQDFEREDIRGKDAQIEIEVTDVLEYDGPALEEIATKEGHESLDAWREEVSGRLMQEKEREIDQRLETQAVSKVAESTEMELPEKFSQRKQAELVQQQAFRMYQAGHPEESVRQFLEGQKDKGLDEVKDMLKRAFVIDAISRKERLVVTEDEIQREVQRMAQMVGRTADEVYEQFRQDDTLSGMREELKTAKVLKMLRQKAKYVEPGASGKTDEE